ncbi:MAG: alpha/beta fold hydrolase, partial [Luteimonas sp.]
MRNPFRHATPGTDAVTGWLEVGDGHGVYFEDRGPRDAPVALLLHGGPGSSSTARQRDWLDAARWRVVQFDQRGCGLSTPLGGTACNDTPALIADIERVRAHLRIERWLVGAGSWGAALALVYAAQHATRVTGLVLRGSFLASQADLDWFFHAVAALAPDAHAAFMAALPRRWRDDPLTYLAARFARVDPANDQPLDAAARPMRRALALALACQRYETALDGGAADAVQPPADAARRLVARYRVQMHYLAHGCFLDDDAVLRAAAALDGIAVAIVHGEHDLTCRPANAHALQ